jgi:hypothetical protein
MDVSECLLPLTPECPDRECPEFENPDRECPELECPDELESLLVPEELESLLVPSFEFLLVPYF